MHPVLENSARILETEIETGPGTHGGFFHTKNGGERTQKVSLSGAVTQVKSSSFKVNPILSIVQM